MMYTVVYINFVCFSRITVYFYYYFSLLQTTCAHVTNYNHII